MDIESSVIFDDEFIMIFWHTIAKYSAFFWLITRTHPEAYGECGQTGHTPDIGVTSHIFVWEIKSVACLKK